MDGRDKKNNADEIDKHYNYVSEKIYEKNVIPKFLSSKKTKDIMMEVVAE